jgi:AMP-activated protein kinase-like protein
MMSTPVKFEFQILDAFTVHISGSYDNWQSRTPMYGENNILTAQIDLLPGTYSYKYIIDGHKWYYDITKPTIDDNYGGKNNLILVVAPNSKCKIYKPDWTLADVAKNFIYKSCGKWIVVMEKLPETLTNECRPNIFNKSYAKFRANTVRVIKIVNKLDPNSFHTDTCFAQQKSARMKDKTINSVTNTMYAQKSQTYAPNEIIIIDDFDPIVDKVCSTGIHYFYSYKAAFFLNHHPGKTHYIGMITEVND